jgi:integrase/recombinase XerC
MNNDRVPASRSEEIKAARMLLDKMGITPADRIRAPADSAGAPTFADYIPRVSGAVSSGTRRVYRSYRNRVIKEWGPRPITDVTTSDIGQLAAHVKATVVTRRNARGGRGAAEHVRGDARTGSPRPCTAIIAVYDTWWDKRAPARTRSERAAATIARKRAIAVNWCAAAALDDDLLDLPGYRPQTGWMPATGTGTAPDIQPPHRRHRESRP